MISCKIATCLAHYFLIKNCITLRKNGRNRKTGQDPFFNFLPPLCILHTPSLHLLNTLIIMAKKKKEDPQPKEKKKRGPKAIWDDKQDDFLIRHIREEKEIGNFSENSLKGTTLSKLGEQLNAEFTGAPGAPKDGDKVNTRWQRVSRFIFYSVK